MKCSRGSTTQATIRDSTRSALVRALIRAARAEFQGGPVVGLASVWPPLVEPPSRKRLPHRHRRRTGRSAMTRPTLPGEISDADYALCREAAAAIHAAHPFVRGRPPADHDGRPGGAAPGLSRASPCSPRATASPIWPTMTSGSPWRGSGSSGRARPRQRPPRQQRRRRRRRRHRWRRRSGSGQPSPRRLWPSPCDQPLPFGP